jgi:hypothetical protein
MNLRGNLSVDLIEAQSNAAILGAPAAADGQLAAAMLRQ